MVKDNTERNRLMQIDRDAGMTLEALSKKYGVTKKVVCNKTRNNKGELGDDAYYKKREWPEWDEWRILHAKYGKKKAATR